MDKEIKICIPRVGNNIHREYIYKKIKKINVIQWVYLVRQQMELTASS